MGGGTQPPLQPMGAAAVSSRPALAHVQRTNQEAAIFGVGWGRMRWDGVGDPLSVNSEGAEVWILGGGGVTFLSEIGGPHAGAQYWPQPLRAPKQDLIWRPPPPTQQYT